MKIRYSPRAFNDLASILEFIDAKSPAGARNVKLSIQKTLELIGEFPRSGRNAGIGEVRVRPAGQYPYLIYWTVRADEVLIVHIRHASRRPWLEE